LHYSVPTREEALHKYEYYRKADPGSMMSVSVKNYEHIHPDYPGVVAVEWGKELPILDWLGVKSDDLVFDIGANRGQMTALYKALGLRVVAVEPNKEVAQHIKADTVVVTAVADREGEIKVRLPNDHTDPTASLLTTILDERADSDFYKPIFSQGKTVNVAGVTLDNLIEWYGEPKYIKIDVEGAEHLVLKGLTKPVHSLSFEVLRMQEHWEDPFRLIQALGDYEFTICPGEHWFPLMNWSSADDVIKYFLDHSSPRTYWNVLCKLREKVVE
jgi:FkbM family methyltransferase